MAITVTSPFESNNIIGTYQCRVTAPVVVANRFNIFSIGVNTSYYKIIVFRFIPCFGIGLSNATHNMYMSRTF